MYVKAAALIALTTLASGCVELIPVCWVQPVYYWTEEFYTPDLKMGEIKRRRIAKRYGGEWAQQECWSDTGKDKISFERMHFPWEGYYPIAFATERRNGMRESYIVITKAPCDTPGLGSEGETTPYVTFRGAEENDPNIYSYKKYSERQKAYWQRIDTYSQNAVRIKNIWTNPKMFGHISLAEKYRNALYPAVQREISIESVKRECW